MNVEFISTVLVPIGLIAIMFSLGLSLGASDFRRVLDHPKPVAIGLVGQLMVLPLLALILIYALGLPAVAAVGLMILAACPGGVTSNAIVFAARGDAALSVSLTVLSSCITVISTPLIVSLALDIFYSSDKVPEMSILKTIRTLFILTVLPVSLGMLVRRIWTEQANCLVVYLRPTSMVVLLCIISSSLLSGWEIVLENLAHSAPAAFLLNIVSMSAGYWIATRFKLASKQALTISVEVGVQNATMATFITLSILGSMELAIGPTIYGFIMVTNAFLFTRWLNSRHKDIQKVEIRP